MIIVFDVNETLLDLTKLRPRFAEHLGDAGLMNQWFTQLLQLSLVATVTRNYQDFGTLARDALRIISRRHKAAISDAAMGDILQTITELEPHSDVIASLQRLQNAGFKLATLTNSPLPILEKQLNHAGIRQFFSHTLSVESVRLFKPHPDVYQMAAQQLGVAPDKLRLIAAHNWDTTGAIRAGCKAAFVARPGMVLGDLDEIPDVSGPDLAEVVNQILLMDQP